MRAPRPRSGALEVLAQWSRGFGAQPRLKEDMYLYIDTMDAVLVDYEPDGRVRLDEEDWSTPSLQERRAILHAAQSEIERLQDLVLALDPEG